MSDRVLTLACWGGPYDGSELTLREDQTRISVNVPTLMDIGFGQRTIGYYERRGLLHPSLYWVEVQRA